MAVEYANILRTLNMMMESRARREDAKTDASLRALQMAQQQERFDKELAFKREQFGLCTWNRTWCWFFFKCS